MILSLSCPAARAAVAALALSLLAACQSYGPGGLAPGTTVDQVRQGMGPPTGVYPRPDGGTRHEYARGPYGKHTYMLDFDPAGRLTASEQVLTDAHFARVRPGMARDEVLFAIGQPSNVRRVRYQDQTVWSYRYDAVFCVWYEVSLSPEGRVLEAGYGPDPICDRSDDRDW